MATPMLINMGLCKCSKRRVTNLFCFVHRVNVCEQCMLQEHPRVRPHYFVYKLYSYTLILLYSVWSTPISNGLRTVTMKLYVRCVLGASPVSQ